MIVVRPVGGLVTARRLVPRPGSLEECELSDVGTFYGWFRLRIGELFEVPMAGDVIDFGPTLGLILVQRSEVRERRLAPWAPVEQLGGVVEIFGQLVVLESADVPTQIQTGRAIALAGVDA